MAKRELDADNVAYIEHKIQELMLEASRKKVPCYAICSTSVQKDTYYDDMVSPHSCLIPAGKCHQVMQHALLSKGFSFVEDETGEMQVMEE